MIFYLKGLSECRRAFYFCLPSYEEAEDGGLFSAYISIISHLEIYVICVIIVKLGKKDTQSYTE
jgi:hypothetical protein